MVAYPIQPKDVGVIEIDFFCFLFSSLLANRTKSNQRWMKLRTTVQISSAISAKKPTLKREDSFLKRFSTRQIPETQVSIQSREFSIFFPPDTPMSNYEIDKFKQKIEFVEFQSKPTFSHAFLTT
jgi:hypothetical protein